MFREVKIMTSRLSVFGAAGALAMALLLFGCATPEPAPEFKPPVYPPPPSEPRYIYEMTLATSAQVVSESEENRWRRMLTGESPDSGKPFAKPFDVVACDNVVYVSDTVARSVYAFDFNAPKFFEIGIEPPGFLRKPLGMAVDADCRLFVADQTLGMVLVYEADGTFIKTLGTREEFNRLSHVAIGPDNKRLYAVDTGGVAEPEKHWIRVYDIASGEHELNIGSRGHGDGELNLPRDAEFGPDGLLYVVDSGNFRVQKFTPDGEFVGQFGSIGSRSGQFSRPKGVAINAEGHVMVSDTAFGNFQIFTPEGELLTFIGGRSEQGGAGLFMLPAGIDVDEFGRIYFVGQFFRKVDIFRPVILDTKLVELSAKQP